MPTTTLRRCCLVDQAASRRRPRPLLICVPVRRPPRATACSYASRRSPARSLALLCPLRRQPPLSAVRTPVTGVAEKPVPYWSSAVPAFHRRRAAADARSATSATSSPPWARRERRLHSAACLIRFNSGSRYITHNNT